MQIQVLQQDRPVALSIISTQKGRQALTSDELTPRERQLLLLLDKDNSALSRQAVATLLTKIDLNKLAKKGWVEYFVFDSKMPDVLVHQQTDSINAQQKAKKLKNFLDEYSKNNTKFNEDVTDIKSINDEKLDNLSENNISPSAKFAEIKDTVPIVMPDTPTLPSNDEYFDDVMIIQTLLNID